MSEDSVELSDSQKELIRELGSSLKWNPGRLAQAVFKDKTLDGRTKEGKAIKTFLLEDVKIEPASIRIGYDKFELTPEQEEFIDQHVENVSTSIEMSKLIWPDLDTRYSKAQMRMCREVRAVQAYMREHYPNSMKYSKDYLDPDKKFVPPRNLHEVLLYVRKYTQYDLEESKLKDHQKKSLEALRVYLNGLRLLHKLKSYDTISEQELFLDSFIRDTWDKDDLTAGEINQYVDLADERVNLENIQRHERALCQEFEDKKEADDRVTMTLVESIDKQMSNRDKCSARIARLQKALEGTREQRLKNKAPENHNLLVIVEALQKENTRRELLRQAEIERNAVAEEMERIESLPDYIAKLYGASKEELLF